MAAKAKRRRGSPWVTLLVAAMVVILGVAAWRYGRSAWRPTDARAAGRQTVADVLRASAAGAEQRLRASFAQVGVDYPPPQTAFLVFKAERVLEVWARKASQWTFIRSYAILSASGKGGPKLSESEAQAPEGIFRVASLDPAGSYHLALKLSSLEAVDAAAANSASGANTARDLLIQGGIASAGNLAMDERAMEELFCLVARLWPKKVKVIIAPADLRRPDATFPADASDSTVDLYAKLRRELAAFPKP